jgi:hypothetical protein
MLGKVLEATVRLNIYVHRTDGHTHAYSCDSWGFSQVHGKKCLVLKDVHSGAIVVVGNVRRRSQIPHEDLPLMGRVRIVEESVTSSGRYEWEFFLEEVDDQTKRDVLRGPLVEPGSIVGHGFRL